MLGDNKKISKKTEMKVKGEQRTKGYIELDTKRDLPIKKAMSAYVLFGNERREAIARAHPQGIKVTEVVKLIAKEWRQMTKQQKAKYKELAKMDKIRFEKELNEITTLNSSNVLASDDQRHHMSHCYATMSEVLEENEENIAPNKPKKPLTPYMIFVRETRKRVVDTMPHVRSLNIMKEVGRIWKTITNKELERYKQLAQADMERYLQEHEEFVQRINQLRKRSFIQMQNAGQPCEGGRPEKQRRNFLNHLETRECLVHGPEQGRNPKRGGESDLFFTPTKQGDLDKTSSILGKRVFGKSIVSSFPLDSSLSKKFQDNDYLKVVPWSKESSSKLVPPERAMKISALAKEVKMPEFTNLSPMNYRYHASNQSYFDAPNFSQFRP